MRGHGVTAKPRDDPAFLFHSVSLVPAVEHSGRRNQDPPPPPPPATDVIGLKFVDCSHLRDIFRPAAFHFPHTMESLTCAGQKHNATFSDIQ